MKLDKQKHAPGTVMLSEIEGRIHEAVIVGWSPLGMAVKVMVGETQLWYRSDKLHAVELLRVVGWEEFQVMMDEAKALQEKTKQEQEEAPVEPGA